MITQSNFALIEVFFDRCVVFVYLDLKLDNNFYNRAVKINYIF